MENRITRYHSRKSRLGYSFASAFVLELIFLVSIGIISIIVRHYIQPLKKAHALSISVVNLTVKKKVKVVVKKKVVKVRHIKKIIKKIVKKKRIVIRKVAVIRPVIPVSAAIQVPSASMASIPSPIHLPKDTNKKIPASVLDKYFGKIKSIIENNLVYPEYAKRERIAGHVKILFKILKNGTLVFEKVEDPSGYGVLNRSALKTINISAPFPGFPKGIHRGSLTFLIKIHFKLEDN